MYFPIGWPKYLQLPNEDEDPVQCIIANRERTLFAVVTLQAVHLWQCKPCVLIVSYRRSDDSVVVLGTNCEAEWKPDSSVIAVATSGGHLLLLKVVSESNQRLYGTKQSGSFHYKRDVTEADTIAVPRLKITFGATFQVTGGVACLCCLKDEMLVATCQGLLRRITWEGIGRSHLDVSIRTVPFSLDLQQSRESLLDDPSIHFKQLKYSVLLGGFAVVLSDGRAAFLTSESAKFSPKGVHAVWAPDVSNATCVAINHKFRLIVFGLANGQGIVFAVDEITGALLVSHRLTLSTSDFPEGCQAAGAVTSLRWTPEGSALILSWLKGGFSLWSTFGALLMCTLGGDFCPDPSRSKILRIQSMEWGPEGYNLWATKKSLDDKQSHDESPDTKGNLIQLSFVKSAIAMNPCMANCEHLLLQGERHIYLSCEGTVVKATSQPDLTADLPNPPVINGTSTGNAACSSNILAGNKQWHCIQIPQNYLDSNWPIKHASVDRTGHYIAVAGRYGLHTAPSGRRWKIFGNVTQERDISVTGTGNAACSSNILAGNKQWHCIQIPQNYLDSNWPIKHASVDRTGHYIAVAGRYGLAHCSPSGKRWKIFGNVTQERDISVTGGLCWWKDFIIAACFNHYESREEIRVYPRASNLDNAFAFTVKVPFQVLLLNVFKDLLIVFCADYHISLFSCERKEGPSSSTATLTRIQDLSLANFVPHPSSLISLTLTSLRSESVSPKSFNQSSEAESLIINVAGRVLMLQRDRSKAPSPTNDYHDRRKSKDAEIPFVAPIILASSVESMWTTSRSSASKPHLVEALWLGCGAAGMKVWLPLFPDRSEKLHHSFLSKRIMLPFKLRIYPLAVLFEDAVVLGAANDMLSFEPMTPSVERTRRCPSLPFTTLERTTQIYLHHLLRQLLRRNLGMHALQIARSCMSLPYFSHVLELMLHEVLEEEATASEPIPDALLPRVVAFIQEFPQYLETVVHCARKTEIALWPYLFASVGNPQDLFEECLKTDNLQTAASYLIILQNLESVKASRHHATMLLDAALEHGEWSLCRDLLRFLRSIGSGELDSPRPPPPLANHHMFPLGVGMGTPASVTKPRGRHSSHSNKPGSTTDRQADQNTTEKRRMVWLPLFPDRSEKLHHSFLSKRIMLPFKLRIYPLAVLFEDAVVLGAANDMLSFEPMTPSVERTRRCPSLPFTTLERTTQIYLHHLLRQLLRRNLGMHALQIARSCMSLPYFSHVLELMLHEVLEEEATASEPIPDALLPRVVAFIQEFPQYLETVVHCARKTEIALWPYLFASVGNPQDLFEECLKTDNLQTAASYLIILQNLESVKASRHHATMLLDAALEHGEWSLCRDLLRFLRSIGSGELDSPRPPPPLANHHMFPLGVGMGTPASVTKPRGRHSSHSNKPGSTTDRQAEQNTTEKRNSTLSRQSSMTDSGLDEYYIETILARHARKLLAAYRLKELGVMTGYLDFKLTSWLLRERMRVARVDSFVDALKRLHSDFNWPLPVIESPSSTKSLQKISPPTRALNGMHPHTDSPSSPVDLIPTTKFAGVSSMPPKPATPTPIAPVVNRHTNGSHPAGGLTLKLSRTQSMLSESTGSDTRTEEAVLKHPSAKGSDETSIGTTEASEGSLLGEGDNNLEDSFWSNNVTVDELEQFFKEVIQHGPKQSEKELRYLLKIVLDASCLEWGLLISIILRDRSSLSQVVNIASLGEIPMDVIARMREGLSFLELWADTECPGYKPLLHAMKPQASVLAEVVERAPSPTRSRSSSASEHSLNESKKHSSRGGSMGEPEPCEDEVFEEEEEEVEKEESACAIS
eukprot:XP_011680481.1 PREDICTED: RAB6A-GEF complex partner protein 1 [Strongylocentrotus purpuratus]